MESLLVSSPVTVLPGKHRVDQRTDGLHGRYQEGCKQMYEGLALVQGDIATARIYLHKSLQTFAGFSIGWDVVRTLIYLGEAIITT
jgi:hypothetical protein